MLLEFEALGAPIRWGSEHFEMRLPPGTLDLPVRFSDPVLRATLERAASRELVMRTGATARTLQRWLRDESLTFSGVRSAALREAAEEMLASEGATVPDVAFRLGFSSRNSFHRAIRRWTGKTPAELRVHSIPVELREGVPGDGPMG